MTLSLCRRMCASLCVCIHAAMLKKPVVTEVRTPTNTWSGLGFSKSMPAETIKELRRANHVPYKPSMSTTYEVRLSTIESLCVFVRRYLDMWYLKDICLTTSPGTMALSTFALPLCSLSQGSPLSLSRSGSREGMGNGSDSDNWRDRNSAGNGLPGHTEFPSAVGSPKRKQNKSGQCSSSLLCLYIFIGFDWITS